MHAHTGIQPRSALGFSFMALAKLMGRDDIAQEARNLAEILQPDTLEERGKEMAKHIAGKVPVVYASNRNYCIAYNWKIKFNETGKTPAFYNLFPELNHNELVGWRAENNDLAVVIIRNTVDYERSQRRIEVSKEVFNKYTDTIIELRSKGESDIERSLYLIHLGDWASYYLAEKKGIDVVEVNVIDHLKSELAKL